MTQFRKKPVVITAITFEQLVAHGIDQCKAEGRESNIVDGMPWSFSYAGHPVTHENDNCYLIPTLEGAMQMGCDDMLITGVKGEIYPCKRDIFAATYDQVEQAQASNHPPHQQRVLDEKQDLDMRIARLDEFQRRNPIYPTLPEDERARLARQLDVMREMSVILGERIEHF
jgi:hypothetical protein